MLAAGDEDLRAGDAVRSVAVGRRLGRNLAEVTAALGLREAHGAGVLARDELGQVCILKLLRPVVQERVHAPFAEPGEHRERPVRGRHQLALGQLHGLRQVLTAVLFRERHALQLERVVRGVDLLEPFRRRHRVLVHPRAPLRVSRLVQRREVVLAVFGDLERRLAGGVGRIGWRGYVTPLEYRRQDVERERERERGKGKVMRRIGRS